MRIAGLFAENFMRLVAVNLAPAGNLVQITGKNAQGKSACMNAMSVALEGLAACPGEPIRNGEDRAQIRVKLAGERELLVTREFTRKEGGGFTSKLFVESADGARFSSPQKMLDEFLGELAFDPLGFTRMKDDERFDAMRSFVPDVDFVRIEGLNKADYDRRTDANRTAKTARAAADMIAVPQGTPGEPIDEAALTTEMTAAATLNQDVERRKGLRARAQEDVATWRANADEIRARIQPECNELRERFAAQLRQIQDQIAALQRQAESLQATADQRILELEAAITKNADDRLQQANELQKRLEEAEQLPDLVDIPAIEKRLREARIVNSNVARQNLKALHLATAKKYEDEAKQLTESIDARERAKENAIAAAKMPVPGLGFGNGVVLLNGVPFSQASSAEQLRTSCAIAMAKNPKLRVCFIRDGSLLDEDGMRLIAEMAEQHQFQVFVEKVDSSGKVGFVIENGYARDAAAPVSERSAA